MKLLNSFVSPFAARVRLAIYAYDLPVEIAASGQWLPNYEKSPDYLAINPIGKVPTLLLDDGAALPESGVIVEYLADAFPATGLKPRDAATAARARLSAQLIDTYVHAPGAPLVGQLFSGMRDGPSIENRIAAMDQGLGYLEHFAAEGGLPVGEEMTIGDCALVPFLFFFAERMVAAFEAEPIIGKYPKVATYWMAVQEVPVVQTLLAEMRTAIAASPLRALVGSPGAGN